MISCIRLKSIEKQNFIEDTSREKSIKQEKSTIKKDK